MIKSPCAFAAAVIAPGCNTICAPGNTAPEGSLTVPLMLPLPVAGALPPGALPPPVIVGFSRAADWQLAIKGAKRDGKNSQKQEDDASANKVQSLRAS